MLGTILVIGVGNLDRGDDGAGIAAARLIRAAAPYIQVIESSGDAADLIAAWQHAGVVYLIDALVSGAPPGTVERFDAHRNPLPAHLVTGSSHAFGAAEAIELARVLDSLPLELIVFGIEGEQFYVGSTMSPVVKAAVARVATLICSEVAAPQE